MRQAFLLLALFCFFRLECDTAFADSDSNNDSGTQAPVGFGRQAQKKEPGKSASNEIRGHCTVVTSSDNPVTTPCTETVLILNDSGGSEVDRARTTRNGDFLLYATDPKGYFQIVPASRFYRVVAPTSAVHAGQIIDLSLREK